MTTDRDDRPDSTSPEGGNGSDRLQTIRSVREELLRSRSRAGRAIEGVGHLLGSPRLFAGLAAAHALWLVANLPWVPWEPWDPYPFVFLATVASVEAPFIALLILMRQQRDRYIEELREEIDLHVALVLERKATAALAALDEIRRTLGAAPGSEELEELKEPLDAEAMMERMREGLKKAGAEPAGEEEGGSGERKEAG